MKKNVKGFMLAETLVVASFISVTLLFLFVQFRTIIKNFNNSSHYNTVNTLYLTNQIKDYLQENNFQAMTIELENSEYGYIEISECASKFFTDVSYCQTLMSEMNVNKAIYTSSQNPAVSSDFSKDFIEFINRNVNTEENMYYLLAEFSNGTYGALKMNGFYFPTLMDKITEQPIYSFEEGMIDGLYVDKYEEEIRYVFRGSNPKNYISFNDELWRIISVEKQGVKIIGPSILSSSWNSDTNFFTKSSSLLKGDYENVTHQNSLSFERLNYDFDLDITSGLDGGYYNHLISKTFVAQDVIWYNGSITYNATTSLKEVVYREKSRSYTGLSDNGYLGLMNVSDYVKASLNTTCIASPFSGTNCSNQNWLADSSSSRWTLNASDTTGEVYAITTSIESKPVTTTSNILPVLYLKPTLRLTGNGTKDNPYIIIEED